MPLWQWLHSAGLRRQHAAAWPLRPIARRLCHANVIPPGLLTDAPVKTRFPIHLQGVTFLYDLQPGDNFGAQFYWFRSYPWEPDMQALFAAYARRAIRLIDIGAHTGLYTLLACALNRTGQVLAFEPADVPFQRLSRNVALNRFNDRCRLFQAAVSDRQGPMHFVTTEDPTMSHLGDEGTLVVKSLTIDGTVPLDGQTSLVKLDVEGSEHLALLGMQRTLQDSHPHIFFECNPGGPAEQIENILRPHGYRLFSLLNGIPQELSRLAPENFGHGHHNFLATITDPISL